VNGEPISVRKCLLGLQQAYLEVLKTKTRGYFELTQLKQACNLLVKIVGKYPFAAKKVQELMEEHFPHQNSDVETIILYQRTMQYLSDTMLRQIAKKTRNDVQSSERNQLQR